MNAFILLPAGEVIQKPHWGKDQPNNYNGEQNCVVLDGGRSWLWNDVGCNLDYLHWICQSSESPPRARDRGLIDCFALAPCQSPPLLFLI